MASVNMQLNVGTRSVNMDENRLNQVLKANSAKEAYTTQGGGLWAKFCDFFCLGNDRKAIKSLFESITDVQSGTDPLHQLERFQKLSSFANAEHANKFGVAVSQSLERLGCWEYSLLIEEENIFKSGPITESAERHKQFLLAQAAWGVKQDMAKFNASNTGTRDYYVKGQIECLSDVRISQKDSKGGTPRQFLQENLQNPRYCKNNFLEIRPCTNTPDLFDAVFRCDDDKEFILRLSNRIGSVEFRGEVAQQAFTQHTYNNLNELLLHGYGTAEADADMRYIANSYRMGLKSLLGDDLFKESHPILNETMVARTGADPVSVGKLLGMVTEPPQTTAKIGILQYA
ncbi:TPA: hypothetical protein PXM37_004301 [Yersinia enterocolitica]|nr:hypothetical protein [Yersinia enterocolitica]HDL6985338.1 hypothetical protein [Yersinia enterocolitica]HDL7067878.1 hypothetical protein [Yersinia enterocolitica]HDL7072269.1 hypothetical protein [Yersinia enterocolitica]